MAGIDLARACGSRGARTPSTKAIATQNVGHVVSDLLRRLEVEWTINPKMLTFESTSVYYTSQGSCGDVRKARLSSTGRSVSNSMPVAVKMLRVADNIRIEDVKRKFVREALVLSKIKHPHIVELIGIHFDPKKPSAWIISPWMTQGDSAHFVLKQKTSAISKLILLKDAASALLYLHSQQPPLRHGDVKAANLLVSDESRGKLSDFGLAFLLDDPTFKLLRSEMKGSWRWSSPEALLGHCGIEADVYALAWLIWELFTGSHPFPEITYEPIVILKVISGEHPRLTETDIPFLCLRELMEKCWESNVNVRARAEDCVSGFQSLIDSLPKSSFDPHSNSNAFLPEEADSGYGPSVYDKSPPASAGASQPAPPADRSRGGNDPPSWRKRSHSISRLVGKICCCCCGSRKRRRKGIPTGPPGGRGEDDDDDDESGNTFPQLEVDMTSLTLDPERTSRQRRSQAFRARLMQDPSYFSLKPLYDQARAADSKKARALVARQVQLLGAIDDPRILSPLGLTTVDGVLHLVNPWYDHGNLRQLINQDLDTTAREGVLRELAVALASLHSQARVHSGLKMENILIGHDRGLVLAEAGIVQLVEALHLGSHGRADDVRRIAPEVLSGGPFTAASDMYAFACVGLEVITGARPFNQYDRPGEVILALSRGECPARRTSDFPVPDALWEIFLHCWDRQPENRPGISEVLQALNDLNMRYQAPPASNDTPFIRRPEEVPVPGTGSPCSDWHVDPELRSSAPIADDEGFQKDSDCAAAAVDDMDAYRGDSTHIRDEHCTESVGGAKHHFISKIWEMVNDPSSDELIRWATDGSGFYITDASAFAQEQLLKVFKHNDFQSFVKQITMYDFQVQNKASRASRGAQEVPVWYFAHKSFVRDKPDLAKEIKRAPNLQTRLAPADPSSSFGAACPSAPQNCMGSPSLPHYTGSGLLRRSTSPNLTAISPSHANSEPLLASYASPPPCGAPYPWSFAGLHNLDATAVLLTSPSLPPAPMSAFPPYYYQPQEVANAGEALSTFRPKARPVIPPFNGPKTYVCAHPGCGMVFKKRNALEQHVPTHTRETPHACTYCGRRFSLKCNLRRHLKTCRSAPQGSASA